jgi:hypothetical protein
MHLKVGSFGSFATGRTHKNLRAAAKPFPRAGFLAAKTSLRIIFSYGKTWVKSPFLV